MKRNAETYDMPFIMIVDMDKDLEQKFRVFSLPALFIRATDNTIRRSYTGYVPGDGKKVQRDIEKIFIQ